MSAAVYLIVFVLVGYFLGGIPWAVVLGRWFFKTDVRTKGSGNSGTTNALRAFGWGTAVLVFLLDMAKGLVPVLLAHWIVPSSFPSQFTLTVQVLAGFAAIMGHTFSPYMHFKGGKGVATLAGVIIGLTPLLFFPLAAAFIAIALLTRYVSVASIVFAVLYPILVAVFYPTKTPVIIFGVVMSIVIIVMHRTNLARLREGTENKLKLGGERS